MHNNTWLDTRHNAWAETPMRTVAWLKDFKYIPIDGLEAQLSSPQAFI